MSNPEFPIWTSFSRIVCSSYPGHNESATRAGPSEVAGFQRLVFARLTSATCCRGATTHVFQNIGDKPIEGIQVEPKKPASARPAGSQDETVLDPKHTKVEFENEQVRVIRYHFDPGDKIAMHGHPDNVQVLLTNHQANVTTPDGKTTPATGKAGETRWRPAIQHVVQNTGDKPFEGIVVEMKGTPGAKAGSY